MKFSQKWRTFTVACVLLLLMPAFSTSSGINKAYAEKTTIKIAFFQPRTATILNFYGTWSIQGFHLGLEYATGYKKPTNLAELLALKEATYNMPDGRKIVVKVFDDQGSPDVGVTKAKEAIEDWGADILAGCSFSSVAAKIAAVAKEYEKLFFMTPAAAASLTQDPIFNKYIFRVARNGDHDALAMIYDAVERRGCKKFAFLGIDYEFGWSGVEALQAAVARYSGCRVVAVTWPPPGCTDFRPYLQPILDAKPDAFGTVWAGDFGPLYRDLAALGVFEKIPYVMTYIIDAFSNNQLNFATPGAEGVLVGREGIAYDAYKINPSPMYKTLCDMIKEENICPDEFLRGHSNPQLNKLSYARIPELWHPTTFATAQFIVEVIKEVPSLAVEKMIAVLEGMTLETPMGTTTIRPEDHQALRPMFVGRFVIDNDTASDTYGLIIGEYVATIPAEKVAPRIMTTYTPYSKTFTVYASATPLTGTAPLTVSFKADVMLGTAPYKFEWNFGDGINSTEQYPTHIYEKPGTYNATVIAIDALGLKATDSVTIIVTARPETPIYTWVLIGVTVVLVVAVGVLLVKRRK